MTNRPRSSVDRALAFAGSLRSMAFQSNAGSLIPRYRSRSHGSRRVLLFVFLNSDKNNTHHAVELVGQPERDVAAHDLRPDRLFSGALRQVTVLVSWMSDLKVLNANVFSSKNVDET